MQNKKKKKVVEKKPKGGKTRVADPSATQPPFAAQGNQGAIFDKIMREKYDWWR